MTQQPTKQVSKFTPLVSPREVGGHVWLIELPGQPITIADKAMAFNLVNRFNAYLKVEELLQRLAELDEDCLDYQDCNLRHIGQMIGLARKIKREIDEEKL